jgi:hypothetical protein
LRISVDQKYGVIDIRNRLTCCFQCQSFYYTIIKPTSLFDINNVPNCICNMQL